MPEEANQLQLWEKLNILSCRGHTFESMLVNIREEKKEITLLLWGQSYGFRI